MLTLSRPNQLAKLDYNNERRRWEAERLREAPPATFSDDPEADFALPSSSRMTDVQDTDAEGMVYSRGQSRHTSQIPAGWTGAEHEIAEAEAEAIAQLEDEELEALLSLMDDRDNEIVTPNQQYDVPATNATRQRNIDGTSPHAAIPAHFGSDDDDYDSIFMDLMEDGGTPRFPGVHEQVMDTGMDMSMG